MTTFVNQFLVVVVIHLLVSVRAEASFDFDFVGIGYARAEKGFSGLQETAVQAGWRDADGVTSWRPDVWNLALGRMSLASDAAYTARFGPTWQFEPGAENQGLYFVEFGIHLSYLGRKQFDDDNFGSNFHFTSLLGVGRHFGRQRHVSVVLDYRHTSNADIYAVNPGVDMISLSIRYRPRSRPRP